MTRHHRDPRGVGRRSRRTGGGGRSAVSAAAETRELPVSVESIAAGGDGVARSDGLVVFLPRTAPGDRGIARVTVGRSFGRGRLTVLEEPSPDRVKPPCEHYEQDRCGGCQLQHMNYGSQLAAKRRIVEDAFERIGRMSVQVPPVVQSAGPWRYRAKLTLALRRRGRDERVPEGTLVPSDSPWVAGLRPYDDPSAIFPLRDCPITSEPLVRSWRAALAAGHLLPEADQLRISARLTAAGTAFVVQGGSGWPTAEEFAGSVPGLSELWWAAEGDRPVLLSGRVADVRGDLPDDLLDMEPGASFVQVNPEVANAVRDRVLRLALARDPRTAVDAYSGTGAYASRLAAAGVRVTAIEQDPDAAAFAAGALPAPSRSVNASVEDALHDCLPADLVIVNPPRAGLSSGVAKLLLLSGRERRTSHLVYVSCNPATLARDAARLTGWKVQSVQAFDMFPQTAHVEVVCEFVPEDG